VSCFSTRSLPRFGHEELLSGHSGRLSLVGLHLHITGSTPQLARPVIFQKEDFVPNSSTLRDKAGAILSRVLSNGADRLTAAELAAAIVLQRQGTIVIMEACKLFSRPRVATTACGVLPAPGIVA
jgi:hypothetical protein